MDKLEQLVLKKDVQKSTIIEHENYVKELIRYVITDLLKIPSATWRQYPEV